MPALRELTRGTFKNHLLSRLPKTTASSWRNDPASPNIEAVDHAVREDGIELDPLQILPPLGQLCLQIGVECDGHRVGRVADVAAVGLLWVGANHARRGHRKR